MLLQMWRESLITGTCAMQMRRLLLSCRCMQLPSVRVVAASCVLLDMLQ